MLRVDGLPVHTANPTPATPRENIALASTMTLFTNVR
jgi:hypothetical protein